MTSSDDIFQMFDNESQKLQKMIDAASSKSELDIHEIIETYYQVMNVSSMSVMLRGQDEPANEPLTDKINATEKLILEQFNSNTHPRIMGLLSDSIVEDTKNLQSTSQTTKSKDEIESDAKLFENLRQKMSTKEFVEQYDKSLNHD